MTGMKRLAAVIVPLMLFALACGDAASTQTPLLQEVAATVQVIAFETQTASPPYTGGPDIEATIVARVQATVRALLNATPIPSPTPTQAAPTPTPEPTSFTTQIGGSFNTAQPPTVTPRPQTSPTVTPRPQTSPIATLGPTESPGQTVGCNVAGEGLKVSAWINGTLVASTLVQSGRYLLLVEQSTGDSFTGQTITFTVGNSTADQVVTWKEGEVTELDLTAPGSGQSRLVPAGFDLVSSKGGPLAQPLPPHAILGSVFDGNC
ncbi:MAG TPA: hypothetical protein EYM75_03140 [Dehalococcoidia bacterium]|nr:hypothetical protein [Dehalococcoidia bacterium]